MRNYNCSWDTHLSNQIEEHYSEDEEYEDVREPEELDSTDDDSDDECNRYEERIGL